MSRAGMRLTAEAEADRDDFKRHEREYGGCSCHISPPCGSCTHPGNPLNQEEDDCWEPDLSEAEELRREIAAMAIYRDQGWAQAEKLDADLIASESRLRKVATACATAEQERDQLSDRRWELEAVVAQRNGECSRLYAEAEQLRGLLKECAEYLGSNDLNSICAGSILHRKMIAAALEASR